MDKKTNLLNAVVIICLMLFVGIAFYQTLIKNNFQVVNVEPVLDNQSN